MELAVRYKVKSIDGDCGGVCSYGTCHVHVPSKYQSLIGKTDGLEKDMLKFDEDYRENSRLSCQITVPVQLDGLVLKVAR
ncbi:MAG: 2Fe-2S ferredoxin [Bacteroidota bacterium]